MEGWFVSAVPDCISAVLAREWLLGRCRLTFVNNSCILCKELSKRFFCLMWQKGVARGDCQGFWFFCLNEEGLEGSKMSSVPQVFFLSCLSRQRAWIGEKHVKCLSSYLISLIVSVSDIKQLNVEAVHVQVLYQMIYRLRASLAAVVGFWLCRSWGWSIEQGPWVCQLFEIQVVLIFVFASSFISFCMGGQEGKKLPVM